MLHYLRKNKGLTILVSFLLIFEWGMQALVSLIMIQCLDAAFQLDFKAFLAWIAIDLLAWGIYFILSMFRELAQAHTIRILNNDVRHDLFDSLTQKAYSDYHAKDSGEYVSWFTNDIKQIETLAWQPFFACVGHTAQVLWCILALTTLHWSLSLTAIAIATVMWLVPKLFKNKMSTLGEKCSKEQASATANLKDLLTGYDVFKQFQKDEKFVRKGDACSDSIEMPVERLIRAQSIVYNLLGYLNVTSQFATDALVVYLACKGIISISVFGGAANLTGGVATGLNQIAKYRLSFSASKSYFNKITDCAEKGSSKDKKREFTINKAIAAHNISFQYGSKTVLKNVSLCFEMGGKYALVGPSGCGKSTLLKILLGWLQDYSGIITIDGEDIQGLAQNEIHRHIGYIEQDVHLLNGTIRENITLGDTFTDAQMQQALQYSALSKEIDMFPNGLDTIVGENGNYLSGGQKQRVAIARALIHNRSILLIDEGTSALDQRNADVVEQTLLDNRELTLILVSHHLSPERKAQFTKVYELTSLN